MAVFPGFHVGALAFAGGAVKAVSVVAYFHVAGGSEEGDFSPRKAGIGKLSVHVAGALISLIAYYRYDRVHVVFLQ